LQAGIQVKGWQENGQHVWKRVAMASSVVKAYIAVHYDRSRAQNLAALIAVFSGLLFSFVNSGRTIEE